MIIFFFILVCSFGCWWFCYSVGGSLLVLFFLQSFSLLLFTYLGGRGGEGRRGEGRGREGRGGEGSRGRGEGRGGRGEGRKRGEGRGEGTQLGSFQATWLDPGPCKNFGKLQFSSSFFHFLSFFYHFFNNCFIMFHHFCFQWWKKKTKNRKLQVSSSSFIFLSLSFFIMFFIMFHHFCFQWCKNFPKKLKIAKFLGFFSLFYHFIFIFLSVFIIFAASGVKIFQKIENCNFTRVFFHCFIIFYLCLSCFYHVSSFLPLVVQKFSKKLKVAIFLEFFSFF